MANDGEKKMAAERSLEYVHDGQVVGLGTGSTAAYFIVRLGARVKQGMKVRGIPTSDRSRDLAMSLGIPLTSLDEVQQIDVTVDGADEFDPQLRLIKGGGGALLREKIVASASRQVVIVADSSKRVPVLGGFPVPVEVVPFAQALLVKRISELGARVVRRLDAAGAVYITDTGNQILDCHFGRIPDADSLAQRLSGMPGIVEHGLFIDLASVVLMATGGEVVEIRR
jgi:ribose 5-phosphate isomerase A